MNEGWNGFQWDGAEWNGRETTYTILNSQFAVCIALTVKWEIVDISAAATEC